MFRKTCKNDNSVTEIKTTIFNKKNSTLYWPDRRAPPKAGLLLLRLWWVRSGVDRRQRKRSKVACLGLRVGRGFTDPPSRAQESAILLLKFCTAQSEAPALDYTPLPSNKKVRPSSETLGISYLRRVTSWHLRSRSRPSEFLISWRWSRTGLRYGLRG